MADCWPLGPLWSNGHGWILGLLDASEGAQGQRIIQDRSQNLLLPNRNNSERLADGNLLENCYSRPRMREAGPAMDGDAVDTLQIVDYLQSGHEGVHAQMIPIDGTRLVVRRHFQTIAELNTMPVNSEFVEHNCRCMRSEKR